MLKSLLSRSDDEPEPEEPEPTPVGVPLADLLDVAKSERRRRALGVVTDFDTIDLTDLAEVVASMEEHEDRNDLCSQARKRVYVSLYQTHVSKLDETGLVQWDQEAGTVSATAETGPAVDALDDLADTAGVPEEIDGVARKPHMGRRFWYDAYSRTTEDLLAHVQDIADEQGSASAKVVFEDYLTDERKRELRREFMREKLSAAFDTDR